MDKGEGVYIVHCCFPYVLNVIPLITYGSWAHQSRPRMGNGGSFCSGQNNTAAPHNPCPAYYCFLFPKASA